MDARLEATLLLVVADREPVLHEQDAGPDQHALEFRHVVKELLHLVLVGEGTARGRDIRNLVIDVVFLNGRDGIAEIRFVFQRNVGDNRSGGGDHVGGVHASPHARYSRS